MSRLDLGDVHQHRAEASGNRRADASIGNRERGVGDGVVEQLGFGDEAEIHVLRFQAALRDEIREAQALADAIRRGSRLLRIGEDDLLDPAFFRSSVVVAVILVIAARIGFRDFDGPGHILGGQCQDRDLAIFGRAELGFVLIVIFADHFRGGRGDIARAGRLPSSCSFSRRCAQDLHLPLSKDPGTPTRFNCCRATAARAASTDAWADSFRAFA